MLCAMICIPYVFFSSIASIFFYWNSNGDFPDLKSQEPSPPLPPRSPCKIIWITQSNVSFLALQWSHILNHPPCLLWEPPFLLITWCLDIYACLKFMLSFYFRLTAEQHWCFQVFLVMKFMRTFSGQICLIWPMNMQVSFRTLGSNYIT